MEDDAATLLAIAGKLDHRQMHAEAAQLRTIVPRIRRLARLEEEINRDLAEDVAIAKSQTAAGDVRRRTPSYGWCTCPGDAHERCSRFAQKSLKRNEGIEQPFNV